MARTYIKDGKHKNIKNLAEYKKIVDKIDCSYVGYRHAKQFDNTIKLEDYYDKIIKEHKDFMEKHNLIIKNNKLIRNE
jgi:hypothetical protein